MRGCYRTPQERQSLETQLAKTQDAALYRRILALLEIDEGDPITVVARRLRVDRRSVYRWMQRFRADPTLQALEHQPGQGRPAEWNVEMEDLVKKALADPPFRSGYLANCWTVPLLRDLLATRWPDKQISCSTVRRGLKAMDYVWKRYRYMLAPDPEEEKKKSHSVANPGFAHLHCLVSAR